jgi:hypothetical protein
VRPLLALLAVAAAVALLALRRRARAWEAEPYELRWEPGNGYRPVLDPYLDSLRERAR